MVRIQSQKQNSWDKDFYIFKVFHMNGLTSLQRGYINLQSHWQSALFCSIPFVFTPHSAPCFGYLNFFFYDICVCPLLIEKSVIFIFSLWTCEDFYFVKNVNHIHHINYKYLFQFVICPLIFFFHLGLPTYLLSSSINPSLLPSIQNFTIFYTVFVSTLFVVSIFKVMLKSFFT